MNYRYNLIDQLGLVLKIIKVKCTLAHEFQMYSTSMSHLKYDIRIYWVDGVI